MRTYDSNVLVLDSALTYHSIAGFTSMLQARIAVITGANSGFGRLTAELLAADGWRVFATMRNAVSKNAAAASELRALGIDVVELDVTDDVSVAAAAAVVLAAGTPDLLVNNAGAGYFGLVEAYTPIVVERQFATNVIGPLRVNRAFLPAMRERRSGLIVYVSSVAGRTTFPLGGVYAASKWALEALAEASAYELAPFGVDTAIVQPGAFTTEIGNKITPADDDARTASYGAVAQRLFASMVTFANAAQGRDPADIAREIVRLAKLPAGTRPLRVTLPANAGVEAINAVAATSQSEVLEAMGLADLAASSVAV